MFDLFHQGKKVNIEPIADYGDAIKYRDHCSVNYGYHAGILPKSWDGEYRISFFEDSNQFDQKFVKVSGDTKELFETARQGLDAANLYRKGNYWCTFEVKNAEGIYQEYEYLFKIRMKN